MVILGNDGAVATYGQSLDTSTNATVYSARFGHKGSTVQSLHIEYAGGSSLTSVATLWASNKEDPNPANDDDWVNMTETFTNITTGTSAKELKSIVDKGFKWLRLKVATSNGSGKVTVWAEVKGSLGV